MNAGIVSAAAAYAIWGLFPLYFAALRHVPALEVLAHRVVWTFALVAGLLAWQGRWRWLPETLRQPRVMAAFAFSSLLLSANWLVYIWAVQHDQVIDASLGYFVTPLMHVLLGVVVLRERPRPGQWFALAFAAAGVAWLAVGVGHLPWVAVSLAVTFATYGLMRKIAPLGALEGLAIETLLLLPLAVAAMAVWAAAGSLMFPAPDPMTTALLIGCGPLTGATLLLFAAGARRITLTTLGVLQYLSPTIQLVLGLLVFREPFGPERLAGFALIWTGLAIYSLEGWRASRAVAPTTR